MINNKLLSGAILLFCCWALCFFVLHVGGVVHLMLLFAVISFLTYLNNNHKKIAFKH